MTRANARELAVHLIYGQKFTGEEPQQVVTTRLEREYYAQLSTENDVYTERPSRAQTAYLDKVVSGVANRADDLNAEIQNRINDVNLEEEAYRMLSNTCKSAEDYAKDSEFLNNYIYSNKHKSQFEEVSVFYLPRL